MPRTFSVLLFFGISLFWSTLSAQLRLSDLEGEISLSNPALAPDGKTAVFIHSQKDFDKNTYLRKLMLIDIPSGRYRILTDRRGVSQPAWAPDGQSLAFLASGDGGAQIYLLPLAGGEAYPITQAPGGVRRFVWSPDGQHLAYITDEAAAVKNGRDRFNKSFEVGSADYLTTSRPANRTIWVTDAAGQDAKQVTPAGTTVGTELSLSNISWSGDGNRLTFTVFPSPFPGDSDLGQVTVLDLKTGTMSAVTGHAMLESSSVFDPSGKRLAYQYPRDGVPANLGEVYVYDFERQQNTSWTLDLDRDIASHHWLKDGSLLISAPDELRIGLWRSPRPGQFTALPLGDVSSLRDWDLSSGEAMLLVGTTANGPAELYFKPNLESPPVQLTRFNQAIADRPLGRQEGYTWKSTDGFRPNGTITYPPDFDPQKKYPLVLFIHGGPTASSSLTFSGRAQLLAAQGWIVFQPNYRGSNNLGNAFQSAIANDAAEGPGEDVITGVRELQKKPYIDSDKIAVSGWSYGGWMTAWLIGRYPEVWAAAVAGAAPVDYTDMYSLNDLNRMRRHAITGSPYVGDDGLAKAYAQSPIMHFSKLRTPTLIMSNTGDYRVTITGSYKLYGALRDNGVPVQFIAYPTGGHFPGDPVQAQDVDVRWVGWLEKYLGVVRP